MTTPTPIPAPTPTPAPTTSPTPPELTARDVMVTTLITVGADDGLLLSWELLCQAGVHHVPVLDHGRCIGLVSERELALEVARNPLGHPRRVMREIAHEAPAYVRLATPVRTVAATLLRTGQDAILVHDDENRIAGIVTVHDLLRALAGQVVPRPRDEGWDAAATLFRLTPVLPAPEGPAL